MPNISQHTQDATVQAIFESIEEMHDEKPRHYLGASIIGKPCARQLWQDFRWVHFEKHDGRLLRLFETGHLAEPRFIENLKNAGVTVYDIDERTGEQIAIEFCGGHFRGHADGVGKGIKGAEQSWHVLEFKTHSEKSFMKLCKEGVQKSKPEHYAQMQVYMKGLNIKRAYYLAVNKNTDDLYAERIKYDAQYAKDMIDRADRIIFANEPPMKVSEKPSWYQCKFCNYSDYCHKGVSDLPPKLPNVNCRTCIHSTPTKDGKWICENFDNAEITYEHQLTGCSEHRYIPMLFPNLELDRLERNALETDIVFYRSSDTEYVNNGKGSMVTKEQYEGI